MISGATLLDYRERYSLKVYFKKRFEKTVIPFIAWSFIGLLCNIVYKSISVEMLSFTYVFNGIMGASFVSFYWFFPVMICIYLSIPLFAAVEKEARKEIFTYLAIAGFVLNCVIPLLRKVLIKDISFPFTVQVVSGSLIYIVIGYLIDNYEMTKKTRYIIYAFAAAGFAIHLVGTYVVSMKAGEVLRTFKGYDNVPCIMYSTGIFVLLRYCGNRIMDNKTINKIVNFISPYTLEIYLLQWFIYEYMIKAFKIDTKSIVFCLGAPFVIVPIAIFITWCLRKIPVLRRIVP